MLLDFFQPLTQREIYVSLRHLGRRSHEFKLITLINQRTGWNSPGSTCFFSSIRNFFYRILDPGSSRRKVSYLSDRQRQISPFKEVYESCGCCRLISFFGVYYSSRMQGGAGCLTSDKGLLCQGGPQDGFQSFFHGALNLLCRTYDWKRSRQHPSQTPNPLVRSGYNARWTTFYSKGIPRA